jgi:ABC-type transport system involved in multi-copper enzyme maturation permease subunit
MAINFSLDIIYTVKIIIGKWIGIVTAIGLLYTACFITTTLLINLFADVQLGTTDMLSLLFIYIIGLFYISGMVLLGIYISIKIRHSYLSLLTSLLIWSLVVLVLPSIPDYMGRMIKVPSSLQVLNNETNRNIKWRDKKNEIKDRYRKRGIPEDKIYNEAKKDLDYAREQIMKEYKTFQNKWETALLKRVGVSTGTSLLSPYACYTLAINEMAATGVAVNVLLMQQRDKYSFKLNDYRKQEQERSKNDPNYKPDYSNIPRLKFEAPSIKVRAIAAAVPVLLLIIFNILFFVLSFRSFQRYDVR